MNSLNQVNLIGALGRDPEIRNMQNGSVVANLSLATSQKWTDRQSGEKRERTEWHRVVVFNPHLCEVVEKYAKKGSKLYLSGQLETRKWQDQSGQDRFSTEVVLRPYGGSLLLLDPPKQKGGAAATHDAYAPTGDELPNADDCPF